MFNETILLGRFVKEPQLNAKKREGDTVYWIRFRIAVNRDYPKDAGADYFNCIAYNGRAQYLAKYGKAGGRVLVIGRLQNGQYEKEDRKVFYQELLVRQCQVIDYKETWDDTGTESKTAADGTDGNWYLTEQERVPFPEEGQYPEYDPGDGFSYS